MTAITQVKFTLRSGGARATSPEINQAPVCKCGVRPLLMINTVLAQWHRASSNPTTRSIVSVSPA